jgi:hypothetical protein
MDFFKHFNHWLLSGSVCVRSFPADPGKQEGGAVFTAIAKAAPAYRTLLVEYQDV